jgi:archaellin
VKNNKFKWIRISLDASNERTWKEIHRPNNGNSFNEIIRVVKFLKSKKISTQIGASFVINDLNWNEIIDFTKLCKKNNFDDVRISFTYQIKREKLYSKHKEEILSFLNQAKKFSDKKFYVSILKDRLESLENKEKNYKKCYFSYLSISIGANLKLYPCCMTKYAKKYCIADLDKNKIDKSFVNKWIKFIQNIKVKKCPTCWYDSFNEMGNYYLDKNAEFENFIN